MGSIQGQVLLADTQQPLSEAEVTLMPIHVKGQPRAFRIRNSESGQNGRFTFAHVPAGDYHLSANARVHATRDYTISVSEGQTTNITLPLTRSAPDLTMKQHQRVYGTSEEASIALSGFVEGSKPTGKDALHYRLFQTRLSTILQNPVRAQALETVGRGYDPASTIPKELLTPKNATPPRLVTTQDVPITEADREGFFYQKISFGKLKTGLYLVDVSSVQKKTVSAWLLVTDTALVIKHAGDQILAYTVDMQAGTPVANSILRTYQNGKVIAQGRTDSQGLATLSLPSKQQTKGVEDSENRQIVMVAFRGSDEAVVQRGYYGNEDQGEFTFHAYTDRPIYRPGQRISFKGIARRNLEDSGSNPNNRYSVPTGETISVELRDPSGERILQKRYRTNGFGSFADSVDLLDEAPTGVYSLLMKVGEEEHTHDIVVASYQKPEYAVTVTPDKPRYVQGEQVSMTVSAQYYFGVPVSGAKVKYNVYRNPDWSAEYAPNEGAEDGEPDPSLSRSYGESYYGETVTQGETTLVAVQ